METISPNLEIRLIEWQSQLRKTSLDPDDQEELRNHLEDIMHELVVSELPDDEIWMIAMKRIGSIFTIEKEYEKVNPDVRFRSNGILLIMGGIITLFLQAIFILLPVYFYQQDRIETSVVDSISFAGKWEILFYALAILLICLITVFVLKGRPIMKYLASLAVKLNIFSAFAAIIVISISGFCLIQLFQVGKSDSTSLVSSSFKTLTQIFYLGQFALIGYFLSISNKLNVRSLLAFSRKLNWKNALLLGSCAGIAVTFSFTYPIIYLPLIVGGPLFGLIGRMISFSVHARTNLFFSQVYIMILCGTELLGNHALVFTVYYFIFLSFMIGGYISKKAQEYYGNY
ncbi:hypothetical protein KUH03_40375 [Sphingobacterium sp. E70]|uniref:hypothetical protein n=1 Tax=Sphingobacterium sp. E70 TaxID=2853439 RepID=UPI00211CA728|nr:hypothetical protein [Sphingobacterium sp. E70]ULT25051.1 hypothetical protein KUH03_40375 [Sphingobacterium sp. E70]